MNETQTKSKLQESKFKLEATQPSEAIVRLNLAKAENIEKFGGRIWTGERGDGRFSVLGSSVQVSNVSFRGLEVKQEAIQDCKVDVRLSSEDKDNLLEALEEIEGRVAEIHVILEKEPNFGTLDLMESGPTKSITYVGKVVGVRAGSAELQSDEEIKTQEDLDNWLKAAQQTARQSRNDYRAEMQAARQAAPVQEGAEENILA